MGAFNDLFDRARARGQYVELHAGEPFGPKGYERSDLTLLRVTGSRGTLLAERRIVNPADFDTPAASILHSTAL